MNKATKAPPGQLAVDQATTGNSTEDVLSQISRQMGNSSEEASQASSSRRVGLNPDYDDRAGDPAKLKAPQKVKIAKISLKAAQPPD